MKVNPLLVPCTVLVLFSACRGDADESPMPGMTAEEHALMQAGGTQGEMDSTGAVMRQSVHLTARQERALGVGYTTVRLGPLTRTIRTVGRIEAPETNIADITPKVDGFVERLFVNSTGETVRRGQRLLTLYSPMLVAAQEELLTAVRLMGRIDSSSGEAWNNARALLAAARRRLSYWDITPEQVERVEQTGEVTKALTLVSPVNGIVLEKEVVEGQQVRPGMRLYRLADLSRVWVEGEVFEQDVQFVTVGSQAHIEVSAFPGEHVMGRVSFVYPTVDVRTRTNRVRVTVDNRGLVYKPGMFATLFFDAESGPEVLTVPMQSVVVTGERNLVFVRDSAGTLQPREVVFGARAGERVEILSGLVYGETIVASANFLVDAESRLASTGSGMPGTQHGEHGSVIEPPAPGEHRHD